MGHAGTLDPLATGLLIFCTGSFTKKIDEYRDFEKEYTGTMMLGATRPSSDLETDIDKTFDISGIDEKAILCSGTKFEGKYKTSSSIVFCKKDKW